MTEKLRTARALPPEAVVEAELAPITAMMSSRLMVLANLLRRGALLRYKRLTGLSSVEFGLVASLGRRPPMSVVRLAEAVGMDKGQISRALAELVSRKLVAKADNPRDNRETLVCLTKAGLAAHDVIVAGAQERNRRLLEALSKEDLEALLRDAGVSDGPDCSVTRFATPAEAFQDALKRASDNDRIVVFGSFFTVAGVMAYRKSQQH